MAYSDELAKNIPPLAALFMTEAPGEVERDNPPYYFVGLYNDYPNDKFTLIFHKLERASVVYGYLYAKYFNNYFHAYAFSQKVKKLLG